MPIWPEINIKLPVSTAWLYGPIAVGAFPMEKYFIALLSFFPRVSAICMTVVSGYQ
jgi:hypothetical protein